MHASHVIYPREAHPDESEDDTLPSHGLEGPWGPVPTPFLTSTEDTPKDPYISQQAKGGGQSGPQGVGRTVG
jgi:hypothetical protein